eukprot:2772307-Pyramimonas_sp.AAC.1
MPLRSMAPSTRADLAHQRQHVVQVDTTIRGQEKIPRRAPVRPGSPLRKCHCRFSQIFDVVIRVLSELSEIWPVLR